MRRQGSALLALALIAGVAAAQQPGEGARLIPNPGGGAGAGRPGAQLQPVVLDPQNSRLDKLLLLWENRMRGVESIHVVDCVRTDKEVNGVVKKWKGEARYLKPNLAALRLVQVDNPQFYELVVSTGNYLYEFHPQFKKLVVRQLPPTGKLESNLLTFLFGMNAADAKAKFDLTLSKDVSEANPHYIYIDILPRFAEDKKEFTRAQLVLFAQTMLPRRVWFEKPNKGEVLWDMPNMDPEVKLQRTDFIPPKAPEGWETQEIPLQQPARPTGDSGRPRVIRGGPDGK